MSPCRWQAVRVGVPDRGSKGVTLRAMDDQDHRATDSGIELHPVYGADDLVGFDPAKQLGEPGEQPFTRGVYPTMYRERLWTMRQYAGMGTAAETNRRFRYLLDQGQTGLSVAFDLPTQMGLDSDHPRAEGEVGKTGVAIDSIDDMRRLFADIPLDRVTTSMTINATAAILLLLYELVAEEQGVDVSTIGGTVQNDLLKEYAARGTYIYPPQPSMRIITDLFAYCGERIPRWNTISISGYHMREAGATAAQEIAFTLANGIAYVQAALDAGLKIDDFAPRLSFFFACHMHLLRGDREVPSGAAHVGTDHDRAVRGEGSSERDAAVPHADGWRHADGAAAAEQHRPDDARGDGRRAGRHAVVAHQLVRRGARAADRARRQDRAAHAAGDRLRDRRRERRRPTRRLVLRRVADRRARAAGAGLPRPDRGDGWARWRRSRPGSTRTRSTRPRSGSSRASSRASGSSWASTGSSTPRSGRWSCRASRTRMCACRSSDCARCGRRVTPGR